MNETNKNCVRAISPEWKLLLRRLPWLLIIPIGLLLPTLAAQNPAFIERVFSQGLYPVIHSAIGFLASVVPFSLAEFVLYGLLLAVPGVLLFRVVQLIRKRIRPVRLVGTILSLFILFGALLNVFYFTWGFQYARPQLKTLLSLDVRARPPEELVNLAYSLALTANELRDGVLEDENGVFTYRENAKECLKTIPAAYAALGETVPLFAKTRIYSPKYVLASEGMSYMGISGIYVPFTGESNVNIHQPPLLVPVSAAHESAHAAGIARENEANFVGYLACLASNDKDLQYSAVMIALINCGNQVNTLSPELYSSLYEAYAPGVKRDLAAYGAYWAAYEGPIEEAMTQVNDSYLKHNQQASGVKSYGEMVDLLLAWYSQN